MTLQQIWSDLVRHNFKYDAFLFHKSKNREIEHFFLYKESSIQLMALESVFTCQSASVSALCRK